MAISQSQLESLYLAYFGRPADFDGLVFYTSNPNFDIWSVAAAFSASPESQALYGTGVAPNFISAATINAIYQNLFNRDAEPAGLAYWAGEVASGRLTAAGAAYGILLGAQNDDAIAVANKLAASAAFTAAMDTAPEIIGYSGNVAAAAARDWLATVSADPATLTAALAGVDAAVAAIVTGGGPTGQTFTLTTAVDTVVGTSANDTIVGTLDTNTDTGTTLNGLDSIDGGAGNDTLVVNDVTDEGVPDGVVVKNVETLELRGVDDVDVDATTWQGLNLIKVTQAGDDAYITAGATTDVEVTNADDNVNITGGRNQTVVSDGEDAGINLEGAAGAVSVTHSAFGDNYIEVDGGTDVTVVATSASQYWDWWWGGWYGANIDVGQDGGLEDLPTGAISVTVTGAASEAGTDMRLGNIWIDGGTTVEVTQIATSSSAEAAADTAGATVYQGYVHIDGGASTTEVTVMQSAAVTEVPAVLAVAGTKETNVITFSALADGENTNIGGLIFTASKDLTAAEVAAAYANLAAGATQGSAPASNGIYSGALIAGWTAGAVVASGTSFTVTVSSATVGNMATDLVTVDGGIDMATVTTQGTAATTAVTGVLGVVGGEVDINGVITGADVLASVALHGYGADSSVASDALATLDLGHSNQDLVVTNASTGATLALTLNAVGIAADHATIDASGAYTTINVGTNGANSVVDLTASAATTLNVGGDKALDITGSVLAALTTVSVTGSASLTMDTDEADTITSFDASGTSGAVTAFIDASKSTYIGGSGVDRLTLTSATVSKAVATGAGDDILLLNAGTTALTANLSGGDGTDALVMNAADAQTASATETFETKIDGFERLSVRTVAATTTNTVNLANLDDMSFVIVNGTAAADSVLALDNMASGGTVLFQTVSGSVHLGTVDVDLTDDTGTADSLNVIVRADASLNAGVVAAAGVETINLTVVDSLTPFTAVHTVNLADAALKTVTVTGNAGLTLTQNSLVLTSVDGSAMGGALTATTNGAVAQSITGGAGKDNLTAIGTGDSLNGGAGADTLTATGDLVTLTGGAGADVFKVGDATTNVNSYATITDLTAGDVIQFSAAAETFAASKVVLADTAVFQDYANAAIALTVDGDVSWFQYAGNTYVIEEVVSGDANLFVNGNDIVVKIVGLVDLSTASFSSSADTLLIV